MWWKNSAIWFTKSIRKLHKGTNSFCANFNILGASYIMNLTPFTLNKCGYFWVNLDIWLAILEACRFLFTRLTVKIKSKHKLCKFIETNCDNIQLWCQSHNLWWTTPNQNTVFVMSIWVNMIWVNFIPLCYIQSEFSKHYFRVFQYYKIFFQFMISSNLHSCSNNATL